MKLQALAARMGESDRMSRASSKLSLSGSGSEADLTGKMTSSTSCSSLSQEADSGIDITKTANGGIDITKNLDIDIMRRPDGGLVMTRRVSDSVPDQKSSVPVFSISDHSGEEQREE